MKKIGNIIFFCFFLIISIPLYSKIIVTGSIDQNYVIKGQTIRYTLTIDAQNESTNINSPDIIFPKVKGLRVISNYNSSSHSFTFINGKTVTSNTLKIFYEIMVLPSSSEKTITIPPVKVKIKGNTYTTEPIQLYLEKNTGMSKRKLGETFIGVNISKKEVYQFEKLNITYFLYIKEGYTISNLNLIDKVNLNDFFVHTVYDVFTVNPSSITAVMVNNKGQRYKKIKLFSYDVAPKKTGKIRIPVISIQGTVSKEESDFFNDPWGMNPRSFIPKRIVLSSSEKIIKVKPLPDNRYKDFSGIVTNKLKLDSTISDTKARTGEGITYTIILRGDFLHEIIKPPKIDGKNIFEVYEPETKSSADSIQYKYLLIPELEGDFKIPTPEIIYFNTEKKKFEKIAPSATIVSVSRGDNFTYSSSTNGKNKNSLKYKSGDIYFLKPAKEIKANFKLVIYEWWYILFLIIGLSLPIIKISNDLKNKKYEEDIVYRKKVKASKIAKRWRKQAQKHKGKDFYSFAYNFLFNYFTNKFYEINEDTTIERLINHIENKIKNREKIEEIKNIFSDIETYRFSPSGEDKKENLVKRISDIIDYFE